MNGTIVCIYKNQTYQIHKILQFHLCIKLITLLNLLEKEACSISFVFTHFCVPKLFFSHFYTAIGVQNVHLRTLISSLFIALLIYQFQSNFCSCVCSVHLNFFSICKQKSNRKRLILLIQTPVFDVPFCNFWMHPY